MSSPPDDLPIDPPCVQPDGSAVVPTASMGELRAGLLEELQALNTGPDEVIDTLTAFIREQIGCAICLVGVADHSHLHFTSVAGGAPVARQPLTGALSHQLFDLAQPLVVEDVASDARTADVHGLPLWRAVRFLAAFPLLVQGVAVGVLCVVDKVPRTLTAPQARMLEGFARVLAQTLELRGRERELAWVGRLLDTALEESYVFDLERQAILYASQGAARRLNLPRAELMRLRPQDISAAYQRETVEAALSRAPGRTVERSLLATTHRRRYGTTYPVQAQIARARSEAGLSPQEPDQEEGVYVVVATDDAQRRSAERELAFRAHHDPLTGLANRYLLEDRFELAVGRARRSGGLIGLVVIDLDDFKEINDRHGHAVGDEVLIHAATMLRESVRSVDTPARIGGDEFVLLLDGTSAAEVAAVEARVREALAGRPCGSIGQPVAFSLGLEIRAAESADLDEMLEAADARMYVEKARA